MPIVHNADFPHAFWLGNGHVQTLCPALMRPKYRFPYVRERLELTDGDFLDLDWSLASGGEQRSDRVALVVHGLEGHAGRKYVRGMVAALNAGGWDCCAMNHRGCSGEMNRLARMYHSGETEDLHAALTHALDAGAYGRAALVGFSMGGNQTLKYLGEDPARVPDRLKGAVAVSAPCDLGSCAVVLEEGFSRIYQAYLMRSLKEKVRIKHATFPEQLPVDGLDSMRTFREFDDTYTAPLGGFASADDYYHRCSSLRVLDAIRTPALVLNAVNDPFLGAECYPMGIADASEYLHLEMPATGGHVGFAMDGIAGPYWSERRAVEFLRAQV